MSPSRLRSTSSLCSLRVYAREEGYHVDGFCATDRAKGISLAPQAGSKAQYLRDRFNIIKQIILRDEHFCPPADIVDKRIDYLQVRRF